MKTLVISFFIQLAFLSFINGQVNYDKFVSDLKNQNEILQKKKQHQIKDFMKLGYQQYPELKFQEKSLDIIPIYSIYAKNAYQYKPRVKDSLFLYLDVNKIFISNIIFLKDSVFFAFADEKYKNREEQHVSFMHHIKYYNDLTSCIIQEKPDMIFTLTESNQVFFLLKGNSLFCYSNFCNNEKLFKKYSIPDYINNCLTDQEVQFSTSLLKPYPPIYCK